MKYVDPGYSWIPSWPAKPWNRKPIQFHAWNPWALGIEKMDVLLYSFYLLFMDTEGEGIKDKCAKSKKEENAYVYDPIQTSGYTETNASALWVDSTVTAVRMCFFKLPWSSANFMSRKRCETRLGLGSTAHLHEAQDHSDTKD